MTTKQVHFRTRASLNTCYACMDTYWGKLPGEKREYCKSCIGKDGMCYFSGTAEERRNGKRLQSYAEGH